MLFIYLSMINDPADEDKFTLLYEEYKEKMFYAANKILKDNYAAEDAVHEAFLRVMKNLHKISDVYCPQTKNYLVIIVKNVSLSMIEQNKKREIPMSDNEFIWEESDGFNLGDECLSKINYEKIVNIIQNLPDTYRDVIYLECVMDMGIADIAKMLSITNEAAKKRSQRGKSILIENLKKEAIAL